MNFNKSFTPSSRLLYHIFSVIFVICSKQNDKKKIAKNKMAHINSTDPNNKFIKL